MPTRTAVHILKNKSGLRWSVILFIISEVFFFISFFWAFFITTAFQLIIVVFIIARFSVASCISWKRFTVQKLIHDIQITKLYHFLKEEFFHGDPPSSLFIGYRSLLSRGSRGQSVNLYLHFSTRLLGVVVGAQLTTGQLYFILPVPMCNK
jgi:hypothetical protein